MPQYYPLLPPRRLGRVMWSKIFTPSKTRTPTCLQDSRGLHAKHRPTVWTHWALVLVTIPSFYFAYTYYFIGYNTAVSVGPLQVAVMTTTEANTLEDTAPVTKSTSTIVPLPTINVEDIIPYGSKKYKKGFQPLVKSPFIEARYAKGSEVYEKFLQSKTVGLKVSSSSTTTPQNPINKAMTCINSRKGSYEVKVNKTILPLEWVDTLYPEVRTGGHYIPPCQARHKVAILVPYSWHRRDNLATFLFNMHPFLMRQNLEYRIFILEQTLLTPQTPFNKGRLYNGGFIEASKLGPWRCVVFHDVDLLPLDHRVLYTCPTRPRHMCAVVRELKADKSFKSHFGGVTVLTPEHFTKANGYSNLYWAWGGEDHDMFWRIKNVGFSVVRYNKAIAQYTMLQHLQTPRNPFRYKLLVNSLKRQSLEGLNTVDYKVLKHTNHHLYTHIQMDVNPYKENVYLARYGEQAVHS